MNDRYAYSKWSYLVGCSQESIVDPSLSRETQPIVQAELTCNHEADVDGSTSYTTLPLPDPGRID